MVIDVVLEQWRTQPPRNVRVGEPAKRPSIANAFAWNEVQASTGLGPGFQVTSSRIPQVFELECRGLLKDGYYRDLEFVSARRSDEISSYRMFDALLPAFLHPPEGETDSDHDGPEQDT